MTQENKELLLKDLCARLPYGIKFLRESWNYEWDQELSVIEILEDIDKDGYINKTKVYNVEDIKPYLFPLSSMTKEQKREIFNGTPLEIDEDGDTLVKDVFYAYGQYTYLKSYLNVLERLNKYHFDYRGLIEKGLAIDATGLNIY